VITTGMLSVFDSTCAEFITVLATPSIRGGNESFNKQMVSFGIIVPLLSAYVDENKYKIKEEIYL
jgi:hypothetical protein